MAEKKAVKKKVEGEKKKTVRVKKAEVVGETKHEPKVIHAPKVKKEKHLKLPEKGVFEATGRRKTSIAHVYLFAGSGKIDVNSKPYEEYFCKRPVLLAMLLRPLKEVNMLQAFDIKAKVHGGGVPAQADAVRLGIARALCNFNEELRKTLRPLDLLKRDPREKERKKYGLKRARRAFQYTKR